MNNISFLIKPASSKCNMKCKYCFYYDVANNRKIFDYGFMSESTMKNLIDKALDFSDGGNCFFMFQGGEPTLSGIGFYEKFISYVNEKNSTNTKIYYSIQTNGTLINREWAKFLFENNFLVGISLDGTKEVNDFNRVDNLGNSTYTTVNNAIKILKKYNVEYNILSVVNRSNVRNARKVYSFFKKNQYKYLQFIPYLYELDGSYNSGYPLDAEKYALFLKDLFDEWYEDKVKGEFISIRMFDNILSMHLGYLPESCDMRGCCSIQNVIEGDGSVYPCDFYVLDAFKLGNINQDKIEDMLKSKISIDFLKKSMLLHEECTKCTYLNLCRGGCKRHKDNHMKNIFCHSYKSFFEYTEEKFKKLAYLETYKRKEYKL